MELTSHITKSQPNEKSCKQCGLIKSIEYFRKDRGLCRACESIIALNDFGDEAFDIMCQAYSTNKAP